MPELATIPFRRAAAPDVEIVVPVHNEASGLERSIRRLHRFLSDGFPFSWHIVIADNASVDGTPEIAAKLAYTLPRVSHLRLDRKGRGRALRAAWKAGDARVVTYMDVDLSTDLRGLLPLVAPLLSGHSDLAIGTRLAHGSRVVRGPKRELISRAYNRILRTVLLVLAQRRGFRIHEVPVDWVDDPDSRVDIARTALADLKGIARLLADGPVARFMGIGVLSTLAYAVLFVALRPLLGAAGANAAALALTAIANTAANRRLTFRVRGRAHLLRHHLRGALVFVLTLALTNGALAVLHGLDATPARWLELSVLIAASLTATISRFIALKTWVFARTGRLQGRDDHARIPATAD
jgi:glycosyltransferase involved in cell wall biosynthesis